jgi:pyridoxamine 5'-phosphate oxidase
VQIADLRKEYLGTPLREADAAAEPIEQFRRWLHQALLAELPEPNAMTLATCTPEGWPSARVVLLRGEVSEEGFVFFTNYDSRKGRELAANPRAALVFSWKELDRQVRIEGTVERTTEQESDVYFASRPLGSRLGALASRQSEVIADRGVLDRRVAELEAQYAGQEPPRPPNWGGFRVRPVVIEFWQGRPNRLHDRLRYRRAESGGWIRERLSP